MARVVQQEINVELTRQNVINSLHEELFQLPFNNDLFERVFPVLTSIEGNCVLVEMSDGTSFKLQVTKM